MKQLIAAGVIQGGVHVARVVRRRRNIAPACIVCEKEQATGGVCADCLQDMLAKAMMAGSARS